MGKNTGSATVRIAYMLSAFPAISETFIQREILEQLKRGHEIIVLSVKRSTSPQIEMTLCPSEVLRACLYARPDNVLRHFISNVKNMLLHPIRYYSTLRIFLSEIFSVEPSTALSLLYHFFCGIGFSDLLRERGIWHIHSHWSTGTNIALAASRFTGIPFSFTAHASGDIFVKPVLLEQKTKYAQFVIPVCDYSLKYLDSVTGYRYTDKLHRVYNGITLSEMEKSVSKEIHGDSVEQTSEDFRIISVGRLMNCKGYPALLKACRILKDKGYAVKCEIIGDGPERQLLRDLTGRLKLEDSVSIPGYRSLSQIYEALAKSDVFVLLSEIHINGYRDSFPTVILEAMAMSLPVVSTWISGIPEMVVPGKTGILVQERDPESAAEAIEKLILDSQLRQLYGRAGRERVVKMFNSSINLKAMNDILMSYWESK